MDRIIEMAKGNENVLAVALFGSSVKGEEKGRDIDVCVFLKKKMSNLEMSNIRLDFLKVAEEKYDVQIFQQLPLYIRIRVLREGKIIYVGEEDGLYDLAFSTLKDFGLFEKIYRNYLESVKNG
jgi:uncharacterized protein